MRENLICKFPKIDYDDAKTAKDHLMLKIIIFFKNIKTYGMSKVYSSYKCVRIIERYIGYKNI